MAKNTGKNFENEIRKSLHGADCWFFRIQDTNDVSKFVKQAVAEKQPADFLAVYRCRPILIECKTTRNLTSFPLYYGSSRSIPSHQVKMAIKAQRHGAVSLILIRRDEPRNKRVWAITPEQADYLYKKSVDLLYKKSKRFIFYTQKGKKDILKIYIFYYKKSTFFI